MNRAHVKLSDLFNQRFLRHGKSSKTSLKYPDLAKVWRSGGEGRNSWSGDLGFLALHNQLDQAVTTAQAKLPIHEAYRFHKATLNWATSLFTQVSPAVKPLAPLETYNQSLQGPYLAEISLFALPVFSSLSHVSALLRSSDFASSFRQAEVFDSTSSVVFLGLLPLSKVFALSPQVLYEFMRIFRPEMINYWQTGKVSLSPLAASALQTLLADLVSDSSVSTPVAPSSPSPFSSEPFLREHVLLGLRFALCHPDGRPHDLLSQRRSMVEDDNSLTTWQQLHRRLPANTACRHHYQASDPCLLSELPLNFFAFALENNLFNLAQEQYQAPLATIEFHQLPSSMPITPSVFQPPFNFALDFASRSPAGSRPKGLKNSPLKSFVQVDPSLNLDYYLPWLQQRWPAIKFQVFK